MSFGLLRDLENRPEKTVKTILERAAQRTVHARDLREAQLRLETLEDTTRSAPANRTA